MLVVPSVARGQDSQGAAPPAESPKSDTSENREERLAEYLNGTQFIGKFTIDGTDGEPKTETYTISSCEKLPTADLYRFKTRIKYGSVDQEVPLDLKILWSGNTPVITLENLWIPGMGTFDAHVLLRPGQGDNAGRYAGTWQHDAKGGHLFGKIVSMKALNVDEAATDPQPAGKDKVGTQ